MTVEDTSPDVDIAMNIHLEPEYSPLARVRDPLPRIVAVHTSVPPGWTEYGIPFAIYGELDPINLTAASLYRAVVYASVGGTRMLDVHEDVIRPIAWFHRWADDGDAVDAILAAADLLEEHGWIVRDRLRDGTERWTPLGRDRPRRERCNAAARVAGGGD